MDSGLISAALGAATAAIVSALFSAYTAYFARRAAREEQSLNRVLAATLQNELLDRRSQRRITFDNSSISSDNDAHARANLYSGLGPFIRELSHNISTPLSQIEAAALSMGVDMDRAAEGEASQVLDIESLRRIEASVSVIKLYMTAYKTASGNSSAELGSFDLSEAMSEMGSLYSQNRLLLVDLPARISGVDSFIILAAVIPLLQNAAEATSDGGKISISYSNGESHYIRVENKMQSSSLPPDIYETGVSTKGNHRGIGLSSVRAIVGTIDGHIDHFFKSDSVVFEIVIPKEAQ